MQQFRFTTGLFSSAPRPVLSSTVMLSVAVQEAAREMGLRLHVDVARDVAAELRAGRAAEVGGMRAELVTDAPPTPVAECDWGDL